MKKIIWIGIILLLITIEFSLAGNVLQPQIRIGANNVPSGYSIAYPENATVYNDGAVILSVNNGTDADGETLTYLFEVYNDSGLGNEYLTYNNYSVAETETPTNDTTDNLTSGTYYFRATAFDSIDNGTWTDSRTFYIDKNTIPKLDLTSPANDSTITVASATVTYEVTDDSPLEACNLTWNGEEGYENDTSITQGTNSFTAITVSNGNYNWSVTCIDTLGNVNTSDTWEFTVSIPSVPTGWGGGGRAVQYIESINLTYDEIWYVNETNEIIIEIYDNGNLIDVEPTISSYNLITKDKRKIRNGVWKFELFVPEDTELGPYPIEVIATSGNTFKKKIEVKIIRRGVFDLEGIVKTKGYMFSMLALAGIVAYSSFDRRKNKFKKGVLLAIPFVLLAFARTIEILKNILGGIGPGLNNFVVNSWTLIVRAFNWIIGYLNNNEISNKIAEKIPIEVEPILISIFLLIVAILLFNQFMYKPLMKKMRKVRKEITENI